MGISNGVPINSWDPHGWNLMINRFGYKRYNMQNLPRKYSGRMESNHYNQRGRSKYSVRMKTNHYCNQRGRNLTTVTRIRLTLILVWIVLVLPGKGRLSLPKLMNFQKIFERPLTPSPFFGKNVAIFSYKYF